MVTTELIRLEATSRDGSGKEAAKRLRNQGLALGIIYGLDKEPRPISIAERHLKKTLHAAGGKHLIEVAVDGGAAEPVMVLEIQRAPVTQEILHIDLKRLDLTKADEFIVPVQFVGKAAGIKAGGRLNIIEESVEIKCLPMMLPGEIQADISALDIGDALYARDLVLPDGVTLVTERDAMLANIAAPEVEEIEKPKVEVEEGVEAEKAEEEEEES